MTQRRRTAKLFGGMIATLVACVGLALLIPAKTPQSAEASRVGLEQSAGASASSFGTDAPKRSEGPEASMQSAPALNATDRVLLESDPAAAAEALAEARVAISGQILDARGDPVAGMDVHLNAHPQPATKEGRRAFLERWELKSTSFRAETSEGGTYRFERLPPCVYTIFVSDPVEGGLPGAVSVDRDVTWNLTLLPRISVSGQVLGGCGREVTVSVYESSLWGDAFGLMPSAEAFADATGYYEVRGIQPGRHELIVSSPGCATESRILELSSSVRAVDFSLVEGLYLAGEITCDFPVHKGYVSVSLSPDLTDQSLFGSGSSGDGKFRFEGLAPGEYELSVHAERVGRKGKPILRTLQVVLTESVEDYRYTLAEESARVRIQAEVPEVDGFVDGRLHASGPHGVFSEVVQLLPGAKRGSHRVWRVRSSGFSGRASFERSESFDLDLPLGTWDLRLELAGYRPWSTRVLVSGDLKVDAPLELRDGRAVNVKLTTGVYWVESRPAGSGPWTLLSSRYDVISPKYRADPEAGWLPVGRYDFRVSTRSGAEQLLENIVIEPSHEPLVIAPVMKKGFSISGRLSTNASSTFVDMHLLVFDDGGWRRLPAKKDWAYADRKGPGSHFEFSGLHPGRYRATMDKAGSQVVGEWTLEDGDLTDVVLSYEFR